jgi:adenylate cyclase
MTDDRAVTLQRRLAAILSADAAGFSRLMGDNDVETVRTLTTCRSLVAQIIAAHGGRVVDAPGDNILAEFASAVDAVRASVAMQQQLKQCNAGFPEHRRMAFRIGVNLGEVLVEDGRPYGDGVNIAARLEALAEVGGICVSGKVYDEVHRKLELAFEFAGEQELHNIAGAVRMYRVLGDGQIAKPQEPVAQVKPQVKPSIIVLPFTNMSGVAEQEFFADGLTEDILTDLSRFHDLFVISRNTSFKFKGQAVDVKKVARDLGVQYIVEGSVRKAGNRVRVTVQLIDAEADRHVWAERYDRDLEDIFAIQDAVTSSIVAVLPGRVEAATRKRSEHKPTDSLAAYECVLEAKLLHHRSSRQDNDKALALIRRAIKLDPNYAHAHAWTACILGQTWVYGWCQDAAATMAEIEHELVLAQSLDDNDSDVHRILAAVYLTRNEFDKMLYHQQRALQLNPNDDLIVIQNGEFLTWIGQPEAGIPWILKAMQLNPFHPPRFWSHLARAHFVGRQYAEALQALQHITAPDKFAHAFMAACQARLGDTAAASAHLAELLRSDPDFTISRSVVPMLHYRRTSDLAHHRESLQLAGLKD